MVAGAGVGLPPRPAAQPKTERRPPVGTPAYQKWWEAAQLGVIPGVWREDVRKEWRERDPGELKISLEALRELSPAQRVRVHSEAQARSAARRSANQWLVKVSKRVGAAGVCGLALDACDEEVREAARRACNDLYELAQTIGAADMRGIRLAAVAFCERQGIKPPDAKLSDESALCRMLESDWWIRRVRAAHGREIEAQALLLGRVWARREAFCSNLTLERRRQQRARNLAALESRVAVNQHGDEYLLAELAETGVSDPENRVNELLVRIKGFEAEAKRRGDEGLFITETCPSRMHARLRTGRANPKYDGTTPREAAAHLSDCWARSRAALARAGIKLYGVRVCEPHHDGTPHWHMLVFFKAGQADRIAEIVTRYFLTDHEPDEPGAQKYRVNFKAFDWAKQGGAVGYLIKYLCKNINGADIPDACDETGMHAEKRAERVEAWAACWGVRQFQVFGGPGVGVWRELRRIKAPAVEVPAVEEARRWADAGDWAGFVRAMGGIGCKRKDRPAELAKTDPGCAWSPIAGQQYPEQNKYGEPWPRAVYGVKDCYWASVVVTRTYEWRVTSEGSEAAKNRAKRRQEDRRRIYMARQQIARPSDVCH